MTRAEQRRQAKTKTPTYNFTEEQIKKIMMNEAEKIKVAATQDSILALTCVIAQALNDEFGFGKDRINRLLGRVMYKFDCVMDGQIELKDLQEWATNYGIKWGE